MTNYLELGAGILRDRMAQYGGITITYKRGGYTQRIKATPARVVTDQLQDNGVVYREVSKDFIIAQDALAKFDPPVPQRGDHIIHDLNEQRHTFIVTGEGSFTSHYEDADSYGAAWRIHTKRDRYA